MDVSFNILTYNRREWIVKALNNIQEMNLAVDFEVIVIDNNSSDGTSEILSTMSDIKYIKTDKNIGISGWNIGFKEAKGKYIFTFDDDCLIDSKTVINAVEKFKQNDNLGCIALNIHTYNEHEEVEGNFIPIDRKREQFHMTFHGAGVVFRNDVIRKIGYFPDDYFLYIHELPLSIELLNSGYDIGFFPELLAYHNELPKNNWKRPKNISYGNRNLILFAAKYYGFKINIVVFITLLKRTFLHFIRSSNKWVYIKCWAPFPILLIKKIMTRKSISDDILTKYKSFFGISFLLEKN